MKQEIWNQTSRFGKGEITTVKELQGCRVVSSVSHCQSENHLSSRAKRMPRSNQGLTLDMFALESLVII